MIKMLMTPTQIEIPTPPTIQQDQTLSHASQPGQFGPTPPALPSHADQIDCSSPLTGPLHDDPPSLQREIRKARDEQQVDLAMLRLAFRNLIQQDEVSEPQVKKLSCSELNQLVSAVVRLHDAERDLLGIKTPEHTSKLDLEYEQLKKYTLAELIELCYKNNTLPPDLCQVEDPQHALP